MNFQQTVQRARQLGRAPNSPEVQAAARAEILRRQAEYAIQQQQQARREESNAARALAKAMETGETSDLTWMKPTEKPANAAQATATPQAVTPVKVLQPNANIKVEPSAALKELNKNAVLIGTTTPNKPKSKTDDIGDLDKTFGSYSPQAKQIAESVSKTGNPVEQAIANAYLWNANPDNPGSAAWIEKTTAPKGYQSVTDKIDTGNIPLDALMNFGKGLVIELPLSFYKGVPAGALTLTGVGREIAAGDLDNAIRGTVESSVANSLIGMGQSAAYNPAGFAGSLAGGILIGGGIKAAAPRVTVPKTQTIKTPGITIKNRTVTIESPLGKTTTINTVKEIKTSKAPGAAAGTAKTTTITTPKTTAAFQKGIIKTDTETAKSGNMFIDTGKRQLTIQKTGGTRTAAKAASVEIIGKAGETIKQTKTGTAAQKVSGVKVTATKTKKGTTTTRTTARTKSAINENIRISQTVNGKTRNAAQRARRTERKLYTEEDGELIRSERSTRDARIRKTDTPRGPSSKALPGSVGRIPKIEFMQQDGITVLKTGSGLSQTKGLKIIAGERTLKAARTTTTGKERVTKTGSSLLTNPKAGTTRAVKTTKEVSAVKQRRGSDAATERKTTRAESRRERREQSARAAEEAYKVRVEWIKINNLIKRYGKTKGLEEAVKRGYLVRGTNATAAAPKAAVKPNTGTTQRQTAPRNPAGTATRNASPGGSGLLMMKKPQQQKQKAAPRGKGIVIGTPRTTTTAAGQVKLSGTTQATAGNIKIKPVVIPTRAATMKEAQQQKTTQRTSRAQVSTTEPPKTRTTTKTTRKVTPTAAASKAKKTEQKKKQKLIAMTAAAPTVRKATAQKQRQKATQERSLRKIEAVRQKSKKRLIIQDEEWKKPRTKAKPKKGKAALRLETINQFGWLGFDAKPAAKPKLIQLQ